MVTYYAFNTIKVWNTYQSYKASTNLEIKSEDNYLKRTITHLVNGVKNIGLTLISVLSCIGSACFDLYNFPSRYKMPDRFDITSIPSSERDFFAYKWFCQSDMPELLTTSERASIEVPFADGDRQKIENEIRTEIDAIRNAGKTISKAEENNWVKEVYHHYTLSQQYYSPAVILWADFLLLKAAQEGKKLLFAARDGIPAYMVAKKLLERFPEKYNGINKTDISLAWLSRKSIDDSVKQEGLLPNYLSQLKIEKGESFIFADSGSTGTRREAVKNALPDNPCDFEFLVSRNPAIHGYLDNCDYKLRELQYFESRPQYTNHWLEDGHQGGYISATKLKRNRNGKIIPNNFDKGTEKYTPKLSKDNPLSYLLKKFGLQAAVDSAKTTSEPNQSSFAQVQRNINDLLHRIHHREVRVPLTHN